VSALVIDPHDMSCQELVELLTEYLDDALGAVDRARLQAHLEVCIDCRAYVDQFRATVALSRRTHDEKMPPELRNFLMKAVRSHDFRI
jgi:anti-sigma factor (TIGR02949 family)